MSYVLFWGWNPGSCMCWKIYSTTEPPSPERNLFVYGAVGAELRLTVT